MLEIKSKFFYPFDLNQVKIDLILEKSFILRLYRNSISQKIFYYLKKNKYLPSFNDLVKVHTKVNILGLVNKDMEYAIQTVITAYENKEKKM